MLSGGARGQRMTQGFKQYQRVIPGSVCGWNHIHHFECSKKVIGSIKEGRIIFLSVGSTLVPKAGSEKACVIPT